MNVRSRANLKCYGAAPADEKQKMKASPELKLKQQNVAGHRAVPFSLNLNLNSNLNSDLNS